MNFFRELWCVPLLKKGLEIPGPWRKRTADDFGANKRMSDWQTLVPDSVYAVFPSDRILVRSLPAQHAASFPQSAAGSAEHRESESGGTRVCIAPSQYGVCLRSYQPWSTSYPRRRSLGVRHEVCVSFRYSVSRRRSKSYSVHNYSCTRRTGKDWRVLHVHRSKWRDLV